ncbi:aspartyl protease family protein [Telluria beijingensis]|uniref:aspartyl protease family protein n=1 Tax=Telluria beijingensis TaxID=3068633 RepID=UPI0027956E75|nr:aspartyl protease family protein [Massilia sp. REN29]
MTFIAPFRRASAVALLASLFATPLHAAQATACEYHQLVKLPIRYTGPSLSPTIEGSIDGTPADMLVDTGAWASMLTRTGSGKRGLQLERSGLSRGIGGYARMYTARVREFRAGPAAIRNSNVRVVGDMGFSPSFDAILSAQFLLQTDLEFSLATKELTFFKPSNCKNARLAYWDADAVEIPFDTRFSHHANPYFTVKVNGKEITAMIDSGAATSALTREGAERAGIRLDGEGVTRLQDVVGIGNKSVARWNARPAVVEIGRIAIRDADIGVIDADGLDVDLLLGADFLRAHRVLFAMSQQKLYISYLGGHPFGQRGGIEPWLQQEADAGNGDAQLLLAAAYARGQGVARDAARARALVDAAANGGNPRAILQVGQRLQHEKNHLEAIPKLRAALDRLPSERFGALWLYAARMHAGQPDLARSELRTTFARDDEDDWPRPIADFYLGKLDEARLLALARKDERLARQRACEAQSFIAERHRIAGDPERARAVMEQAAECRAATGNPAQEPT